MNDVILQRKEKISTSVVHPLVTPSTSGSPCSPACSRQVKLRQFLSMEHAFVRTGGLASGDEVAQLLRQRSEQPISTLARWIVSRTIVNFEWQSQTLIPLFQFDLQDMSLSVSTVRVVREMVDVFDDWELAFWFAQSNSWIDHAAPCELIATNAAAVLQAARTDRFIARG